MFVNYEGNLTSFDTLTVTKKLPIKKMNLAKNLKKLIYLCENSNDLALKKWSKSLKKTSSDAFYNISRDAVYFSQSNKLLEFFRILFSKKNIFIRFKI